MPVLRSCHSLTSASSLSYGFFSIYQNGNTIHLTSYYAGSLCKYVQVQVARSRKEHECFPEMKYCRKSLLYTWRAHFSVAAAVDGSHVSPVPFDTLRKMSSSIIIGMERWHCLWGRTLRLFLRSVCFALLDQRTS